MSMPVTEDTPPDMLAGSMDLSVILPNGQTVKMIVQRGTPMMDLLVQATTTHCLSPGDYSLQAMGDKGVLPFKPNTPIGALDTFAVKIVEKKSQGRGRAPQVPQSFLNTFRLQIHLPRSQLFVLRVTPDITLHDILIHVCTEKNLTAEKYEFRNTVKLNEVLELDKTLGYYKIQELSLVNKNNTTVTGLMSSADLLKVKSSKHRQNSVCDSSLSSGSLGSRSGSPVPAIHVVTSPPPQPPKRKKRRPAPKPPSFADKEEQKKDINFGSVLISHSRESSDSSGYHEASILSESPTHGGPVVGSEGGSPPDTLPRRSKLPSSQSFTNLTSIQPAPKGRLITSVSNTSLNSNGCSRKKRAPPPPLFKSAAASSTLLASQSEKLKENKIKSSTLPISKTGDDRNDYSSMNVGSLVASAKIVQDENEDYENGDNDNEKHNYNVPTTDGSDAKVQIPLGITSRIVKHETKASNDELSTVEDVGIKVPPKPKPRTVAVFRHHSETIYSICSSPSRRSLENLKEEDGPELTVKNGSEIIDDAESALETLTSCKKSNGFLSKNGGDELLGTRERNFYVVDSGDQGDHDSINWEYQLPPPPSDFRDTNSPTCTEFGTITITPEILERMEPHRIDEVSDWSKRSKFVGVDPSEKFSKSDSVNEKTNKNIVFHSDSNCFDAYQMNNGHDSRLDKKTSHEKPEVMSELTNILNIENRKQKGKSLSVSNLYINETVDQTEGGVKKSSQLNYSRSFSADPEPYLGMFEGTKGKCLSKEHGRFKKTFENREINNDEKCSNREITYKNYRNLEKSSSLECIEPKHEYFSPVIGRAEDFLKEQKREDDEDEKVFKKPVAFIQKKAKMARRSASSIGTDSRKFSIENEKQTWTDDPNLNILRQQFLEFLKEKKLMNADLKMKSFDVLRNILPEVMVGSEGGKTNEPEDRVMDGESRKFESASLQKISHERAQEENGSERDDRVKIVDVRVKSSVKKMLNENSVDKKPSETNLVTAAVDTDNHRNGNRNKEEVTLREKLITQKPEAGKRYSYQGPPSINFGTWGERPKTTTKIIIKDEDYITREKVTERKADAFNSKDTTTSTAAAKVNVPTKKPETKPDKSSSSESSSAKNQGNPLPEVKKTQIVIKKPGVLSHYEMFSALPKRKEISSLRFFLEEEERRKSQQEANRVVPVVCGIELKKEVKEAEVPNSVKQTPSASLPPQSSYKSHSVSVYVNGNMEAEEKPKVGIPGNGKGFIVPKRNPSLMPVVKGFRSPDEQQPQKNALNAQSGDPSKEERRSSLKCHSISPNQAPIAPSPPTPPSITSIKLKGDCNDCRRTKMSFDADPRTQLLDEIRNFGGLRKLKKSAVF